MAFNPPSGFGSNPARGRPTTSLAGRTTAGSHRVFQRGPGGTRSRAGRGRPIEDMPRMFRNLQEAAEGLPVRLVYPLSIAIRDQLQLEGAKYRLRGASGKKVALTAHTKAAKYEGRSSKRTRFIDGTPKGFWRIVNDGSAKHLIAGRYRRSGGRLTVRGAARQFGFNWSSGQETSGGSMGIGSPINTYGGQKGDRDGWAQYAIHPGHGPLGRPWRRAMDRSGPIMQKMQADYASDAFVRAFFR